MAGMSSLRPGRTNERSPRCDSIENCNRGNANNIKDVAADVELSTERHYQAGKNHSNNGSHEPAPMGSGAGFSADKPNQENDQDHEQ